MTRWSENQCSALVIGEMIVENGSAESLVAQEDAASIRYWL